MSSGPPWWFWLAAVAIPLIAVARYIFDLKRGQAIEAFAAQRGLAYAARDNQWARLDLGFPHGEGRSHKAKNVLTGEHNGRQIAIFEHEWVTGSGDNRTTHTIRVTAMKLPRSFPTLEVTREGVLTRAARRFGVTDIELESEQFNEEYRVRGDRRLAYDILNPRFMEWMLAAGASGFTISGSHVAYKVKDDIDLDHIDHEVAYLDEIVRRLPRYVTD